MSTELKRNFIEEEISDLASDLSIKEDDAFMYWFYMQHFGEDYEDIDLDDIVDGAGERQIDIIRVDIDDSNQKVNVAIIQIKNTEGFSSNVVNSMAAGLKLVFSSKKSEYEKLSNNKFKNRISDIRDAIKTYGNNNLFMSCYFVTMGDEADISQECRENAQLIRNQYSDGEVFGNFEFIYAGVHDLDRIVNLKRSETRRVKYDLPIVYDANRASIIEFDTQGIRSLLCTASGAHLAQLAQTKPRDAVFDANVRGNLGLGGRVNKSILESATNEEEAQNFWFMNNGITMVCESFSIVRDPDDPKVKLDNLQIINGCQTTSTIRSAFEDGTLSDDVKVQIKIYEAKDRSFINKIVVATNNQNAIGTRDLHANDEIQGLIQRYIEDNYGLFYERKRGEAKSNGVQKQNVINMEKAGQAYIAIFKRSPTISRAQKYKVFSQDYYSDIFEKSKPWQLVVAHEVHKFCNARGRKAYRELEVTDPERNIYNYGVFHISRILWWVLERDVKINSENAKELVSKIRAETTYIENSYNEAKEYMKTIAEKNNESLINLNNYFKKSNSQQDINRYLKDIEEGS